MQYNFHDVFYFCYVYFMFIVWGNSCLLGSGAKMQNPVSQHVSNLQTNFSPIKFLSCACPCVVVLDLQSKYQTVFLGVLIVYVLSHKFSGCGNI
jgi:hypothetical protein